MEASAKKLPDGDPVTAQELKEVWAILSAEERVESLRAIPHHEAGELFLHINAWEQADILRRLPSAERRSWIRLLPPDDAADVIQAVDTTNREHLLSLIDDPTRREVNALLAYAEDHAGGLMSPRYARVRPDMSLDEAIAYLKRQARTQLETIYYIYVLDEQQHLLGVVSFRDLFSGAPDAIVRDIMSTTPVKALDSMDQEALSKLFSTHSYMAIPIVDKDNVLKGIVTMDDIVDVVKEEATEDIQKIGGMEALDEPYLTTNFLSLIRKRAGWLSALFLGEMLTATAMGYFEQEIARAVVLALFVPLIISSGGNSGAQATTLVIRAMALGEVKISNWWRVIRRELFAGVMLGTILGSIGFTRILVWQAIFHSYGEHYFLIASTVFLSLIGVVCFGTLAGSGLPFLLKRLGFDPASASAPFVATLVDVTGLVIYFSVAGLLLRGALL